MKLTTKMTTSENILGALALNGSSVLAAEKASYESNGIVEFTESNDITKPIDPTDPGEEVDPIDPTDPEGPNPGTDGPLSIDYASSLHFGVNKITNADQTYFADAQEFNGELAGQSRGNYVQISDHRGTVAGWTLTVAQTGGQFESKTAKQFKILTGSLITFGDAKPDSNAKDAPAPTAVQSFELDSEGASSLVMSAKDGQGAGTWVDYFGESEVMTINGQEVNKNKAVTLDVPGSTPKEATVYKTSLTWTLTDAPGQ